MSPYGWGHSHLLGRVKYHLRWLLSDMNVQLGHALLVYLAQQEVIPEVTRFGVNEKLTRRFLKVTGLEAYQVCTQTYISTKTRA